MPTTKSIDPQNKDRLSTQKNGYVDEFVDVPYNHKKKVNCICPKCSRKHVMAFHWIGRGTPRKYCPSCKSGYSG